MPSSTISMKDKEQTFPKARLLVVEDERIEATSLNRHLLKLGYKVVAMVDAGEEAIQKARELRPDLILMDISLEGKMDGVEAASKIRKSLQLPVVFLTGNASTAIL